MPSSTCAAAAPAPPPPDKGPPAAICLLLTAPDQRLRRLVEGRRKNTEEICRICACAASKGAAEFAIRSHVKSFFPKDGPVRVAVGRAGNVIGGGDWAADRIVPDCVRSWASGKSVQLRNPSATRPWQHVLEPLSGYLSLADALSKRPELHGEPFNFGPPVQQAHSVLELVKKMSNRWDQVRWDDVSGKDGDPYESGFLKLNCDKALHHLKWHAVLNFEETIKMTTEWYQSYYKDPQSIRERTVAQIEEYTRLAADRGMAWAQ